MAENQYDVVVIGTGPGGEGAAMQAVKHGLKVAVDKKSDLYLDGTTVDFYDGLDRRGFTFNNPNVSKSCGCGSSFSV